jgi:AcrR family transcriptional regulator
MEATSRPAGTRRRGAALEEVILEAAWAELTEAGYERTTVASVAARAQTGKQVLYRRWRNRAQLAVAAVNHHVGPLPAEPADTGSLRGDVLALLEATARRVEGVDPGILRGILSEMVDEDNVFASSAPRMVADLLDRAVARGELAHSAVPARVLSLPVDLGRQEFARMVRPGNSGQMERLRQAHTEIVDQVFLPLVRSYSE